MSYHIKHTPWLPYAAAWPCSQVFMHGLHTHTQGKLQCLTVHVSCMLITEEYKLESTHWWNWYWIVKFHWGLQFYTIPDIAEHTHTITYTHASAKLWIHSNSNISIPMSCTVALNLYKNIGETDWSVTWLLPRWEGYTQLVILRRVQNQSIIVQSSPCSRPVYEWRHLKMCDNRCECTCRNKTLL